MSGTLKTDVHVRVNRDQRLVFRAGSVLPKEYEHLVTNPAAFVDGASSVNEPAPAPVRVNLDAGSTGAAETEKPVDYTKGFKKGDLEKLATERGLDAKGTIPVLAARLAEHDAEQAKAKEAAGAVDLSALDEGALRALAGERKVDISDATSAEEIIALLENAGVGE